MLGPRDGGRQVLVGPGGGELSLASDAVVANEDEGGPVGALHDRGKDGFPPVLEAVHLDAGALHGHPDPLLHGI